jgi:transposase
VGRWSNNLPINGQGSARISVLPGPERRRRWSAEEKAQIVAESFAAGSAASSVARRYGLHRNQLYAWRREIRSTAGFGASAPGVEFARVVVTDRVAATPVAPIEIGFGWGVLRVAAGVDADLLAVVLRAVKQVTA